jgi:predicted permease
MERGGGGHGLVRREDTSLVWAALAVGLTSVVVSGAYLWYETRLFRRRDSDRLKSAAASSSASTSSSTSPPLADHVTTLFDAVGNTPLLRVRFLFLFIL